MPQKNFNPAVNDFAHSVGLLVRRVRSAAPTNEISLSEAAVISRLDNNGPATTADLARAESVKPQSMGTIVARLESLGLVKRKPHPTDGRQMNIELTAKGSELRKRTREAKRTWLAHAISELSKQDQATLFAAGEIIKRLAER